MQCGALAHTWMPMHPQALFHARTVTHIFSEQQTRRSARTLRALDGVFCGRGATRPLETEGGGPWSRVHATPVRGVLLQRREGGGIALAG